MKSYFKLLLVFISLTFLVGCGSSSNNNDGSSSSNLLKGTVKSVSGSQISGAKVNISTVKLPVGKSSKMLNDEILLSLTTDKNGVFSTNEEKLKDKKVSITVTHPDYSSNSKVIEIGKDDTSVNLDISLVKNDVEKAIDSTIDNTIDVKEGKVSFKKNSFIDKDGNAYTGNVNVNATFNQVTNYQGRNTFPGNFEGIREDGSETFIESYGFFNIELLDDNGDKINLSSDSSATLTFPLDDKLGKTPNNGDTIPLWYYSEEKGNWIEEGFATFDGTNFVGEVKHFTPWNLDAPIPKGTVSGKVVDAKGNPIIKAIIQASTANWVGSGATTDTDGKFNISVPAETNLTIKALKDDKFGTTKTFQISDGEDKSLSEDIVIKEYNKDGTNPDRIIKYLKGKFNISNQDDGAYTSVTMDNYYVMYDKGEFTINDFTVNKNSLELIFNINTSYNENYIKFKKVIPVNNALSYVNTLDENGTTIEKTLDLGTFDIDIEKEMENYAFIKIKGKIKNSSKYENKMLLQHMMVNEKGFNVNLDNFTFSDVDAMIAKKGDKKLIFTFFGFSDTSEARGKKEVNITSDIKDGDTYDVGTIEIKDSDFSEF